MTRRAYTLVRGDHFASDTFTLTAPTGEGLSYWGSPTVACQIRRSVSDADPVHVFTVTPSSALNADGEAELTFSLAALPAVTADWSPGGYVGDIEVSADGFLKQTVIAFTLTVIADVTR